MATQTTSLSSVGVSPGIILNPVSKTTTLQVTFASTASTAGSVQFTLDDPTTTPPSAITWGLLSSFNTSTAAATITDTNGAVYTVLSPLGGVRLSGTTVGAAITLKALQAVTA